MKLSDIGLLTESAGGEKIYAWFEPSRGPEDIRGVRLAYIQDLERHHDDLEQQAIDQQDDRWLERIRSKREMYRDRGQKFFTPDFGWWQSERDFEEGKGGFGGKTKEHVFAKHPGLEIVDSREEAIRRAGY